MANFQNHPIKNNLVPSAALTLLLFNTMSAVAGDEPPCPANSTVAYVQGTVSNSAFVKPGTSGLETVGVAQMVIQGKGMMRCALHGVAIGQGSFIDTLVCDDKVAVPNSTDTVHSQLITYTHFTVPPTQTCTSPAGAVQGSFSEISDPFFGQGAFSSTGGGRLHVQGTINCAGSVDMSFYGNVCLVK